jgi:hypothetical protein
MVDREQAELEISGYRKELESQRAGHDNLYSKYIETGKKLAAVVEEKSLCLCTIVRIVSVLVENKHMPHESTLQGPDSGMLRLS